MMDLMELKKQVVEGNRDLPKHKLVKFSWGNVSAVDREAGLIVIKPVGIPYPELTVENVSVTDLAGRIVEGPLKPSVDLDIHRALYEHFPDCAAIVHTHSTYATVLAQLHRGLPCFGTTHADYFAGEVPCVDDLCEEEILNDYEWNTGMAIVNYFKSHDLSPKDIPAALSVSHGVFTWGSDVFDAVHKAVVLEEISKMAVHMLAIEPARKPISKVMSDKHYYRKHGAAAYFTNDDYGHGMIQRT